MRLIKSTLLAAAALAVAASAEPAAAQGSLGRLKDRAKQKIEQKAGEKVDRAIDQAVDGAPAAQPAPAGSAAPAPAAAAATLRPGEGAFANYDFVPGERMLFVDDFSRDRIGNFPQRFEFKSGSAEVVEWQGARYLRATAFGTFFVPLPEVLPEKFTIEFDYSGPSGWDQNIFFTPDDDGLTSVTLSPGQMGLDGGGIRSIAEPARDARNRVIPIRVQVDGRYAKVFAEEKRVGNAPNANLGRSNKLRFVIKASEDAPLLIGNLRIAAGGRTLYDALAAEGRVATQGILFDTGSDRIQPESTPTLREIGDMLKQHPAMRLRIEGHTDNVGQAASNQSLSEKRAEAVRQYLVGSMGIDAARLEAAGLGQSKPAASNDSPEGRQQNRRVELVRL